MSKSIIQRVLKDEAATGTLGKQLAKAVHFPLIVFLEGDLGAGKTTLVRGFLQEMGYPGKVKSPTYTLVEIYPFIKGTVYHFDLYRIAHAEELEFIGIHEYFSDKIIALIEWPKQGAEFLPKADLKITLQTIDEGRNIILEFLSSNALNLQKRFLELEKER